MRRILLILVALLLLVGVGVGIYFFFFAPKNPGVVVETPGNLFGDSGAFTPTTEAPSLGEERAAGEEVAPRLIRITEGPVAEGTLVMDTTQTTPGETATSTPTTTTDTEVRYIERETGNMYVYKVRARTLTRITNQTLPGIQKAAWATDGSYAFVQFLSEDQGTRIETYALPDTEGEGYFLEPRLSSVVVNTQNQLLTLLPSTSGSVATRAAIDGTNVKTLFSSPLAELRVFAAGNNYVAHTKASASLDGYGFLVNGTTGTFERILGPLPGLTLTGSPDGTLALGGYRVGNSLSLVVINLATRDIVTLPVATLPEKCVWKGDSSVLYCAVPRTLASGLPDTWYQGAVSFSDRIWKIDLSTRLATLVVDPSTLAQTTVDAVALALDEDAEALTFTNRIDGSLWLYDL